MNDKNSMRVITLKDLWDIFVRRIVTIFLAAVLACSGSFLLDRITYRPQYTSTATLYILRENSNSSTSSGEVSNDFALALKVVYDCNYLLRSRTVVNQVIEDLGLELSYSNLYNQISARNPSNTRILEVTVTADTPELAKQIVDHLCEIGCVEINKAMGYSQVNLYEYGALNSSPSNRTGMMTFAAIGVAAAVLVYAFYLLRFLLDDHIRTEEDIESVLGLSILAEIPNLNGSNKKGYRFYSYGKYGYGRYGYGRHSAYAYRSHRAQKNTPVPAPVPAGQKEDQHE